MCEKDNHNSGLNPKVERHLNKRFGASLADRGAHVQAHRSFGRRDFMRLTGLATLGSALTLGAHQLQAFAPGALLSALNTSECGDRILLLVRLKGGNDGLNMVIPRSNDEYYNIRPTIAVQESGLWALSDDFGMPNEMQALRPFWEEGHMQIVHNVGYPDANYSHFRSSDIWASASESDEIVTTGWIGRMLENQYQAFLSAPPVVPPALQIGVETNMIFRAIGGNMALSINNPQEFYQIALTGELYDLAGLSNSPADRELAYVRQIANSAFRYSENIRDAYNASVNQASYPNHYFSEQLAIIARLIKGGLGTKVYLATIDGFDTHAEQANAHPLLLQRVADSLAAFFNDLRASGHSGQVMAMTFSEFGRTIYENGSVGTDHGTGSPMIVMAENMGSRFHGEAADLVNLDQYGDPFFSVDFRHVYGTVLQNWMCVHPEIVGSVLGQSFPLVNELLPTATPPAPMNDPGALLGHNPDPNEPGVIQIKYALRQRGPVRVTVGLPNGSVMRILTDSFHERGSYTLRFRPSQYYLGPGEYRYRLETGGRIYERPINW